MNISITSYVRLTKQAYIVNDKKVFFGDDASNEHWLKQLYKYLQPDYPKFYKMDQLAQAAFLSVEILKQAITEENKQIPEDIALVFANRETSSVTDQLFIDSYTQTPNASPSLFVYTLPNISLGEVCIRNKWYGENIFAVFPKFALDFYQMNAATLLATETTMVIGGWVNIAEDTTDVIFFTLEKESTTKQWQYFL